MKLHYKPKKSIKERIRGTTDPWERSSFKVVGLEEYEKDNPKDYFYFNFKGDINSEGQNSKLLSIAKQFGANRAFISGANAFDCTYKLYNSYGKINSLIDLNGFFEDQILKITLSHNSLEKVLGKYNYEHWNEQKREVPRIVKDNFFQKHRDKNILVQRGLNQSENVYGLLEESAKLAYGLDATIIHVDRVLSSKLSTKFWVEFYRNNWSYFQQSKLHEKRK